MELKSDGRNNYPTYRWVILSLLFAATTINYLDRIVLSVVVQHIREEFKMDEVGYGYVVTTFRLMYMCGFLVAGKIIDRVGTKLSYCFSILFWSLAASLTGLSGSSFSLAFWRGMLGLTESANFPAAIKSVSEWFPTKQRSFATSLFNSGPSIALVIGPPIVAAVTLVMGWRWAFGVIGATGFVMVVIWPFIYRQPKHLIDTPKQEQEPSGIKLKWRHLLKHRETYGIMMGKFCADPVWWFYISWLPLYLYDKRGFNIKEVAIAMPLIYSIAIILGNLAGWIAGYLIAKGWPVRKARKTVMLACAMCMPISSLAVIAPNPWVAILLVSLACSAHNGWSANVFTLSSDCFPSKAVGSVTGLVGFAGALGGILIAALAPGPIIKYLGYVPIFMLMGILHPFAIVCVHLLIKEGKPIEMEV